MKLLCLMLEMTRVIPRSLFLFSLRWNQNPLAHNIIINYGEKKNPYMEPCCGMVANSRGYSYRENKKQTKKTKPNLLSLPPKGTPGGLWNIPVRFHLTQGHHFRLPPRKLLWWKSVLPNFPGKRPITFQVPDCNGRDKMCHWSPKIKYAF